MSTPDRVPRQDTEDVAAPPVEQSADVSPDSPLPDVPDAGDESQPMVPSVPPDLSSDTLFGEGAVVASTFDDEDERTLYEQTLDAERPTTNDERRTLGDEGRTTNDER